MAGGMLAPWCERESCGELIARLGAESLPWWQARFPGTVVNGTLVVAHARDTGELLQFGRRTAHFERVGADRIAGLEPELAGRFAHGLYFPEEGFLEPRAALAALLDRLSTLGVPVRFGLEARPADLAGRTVVDCSGLEARATLADLRGVKGEMLLLHQQEIRLHRPVRLLHPRLPVYIVPRAPGLYMVGATAIESDDAGRITARSMLDLLSAAYALHPAFGEAGIVETAAGVRPAFPDNQPRLRRVGGTLYVNGLYRHGFLIAPALARRAAGMVLDGREFPELLDADPGQRDLARRAG